MGIGEDMWHAYNLIREGDAVTATTFRKVQKESGGTSAGASERVKIKLTIKVEDVDFDAEGLFSLQCHTSAVVFHTSSQWLFAHMRLKRCLTKTSPLACCTAQLNNIHVHAKSDRHESYRKM